MKNIPVVTIFLAIFAVGAHASAGTIMISPSSWNAGTVTNGFLATKLVTITNTGSVAVTINSVTANTSTPVGFIEFGVSGITLPKAIVAHGTATFTMSFLPLQGGSATGTVVVQSTATNNPVNIGLSGLSQHRVDVSWTASASASDPCISNISYNIYVTTTPGSYGGAYTSVAGLLFMDNFHVVQGTTYYYSVTMVGTYTNNGTSCTQYSTGASESPKSSEISASIPNP